MLQTPRRVKELHLLIRTATERLTQQLGRPPRLSDLVADLGRSEQDVREALGADDAFHPLRLDAPLNSGEDEAATLAGMLGQTDDRYQHVEDLHALLPLLAELPSRERYVLVLRFFGNLMPWRPAPFRPVHPSAR